MFNRHRREVAAVVPDPSASADAAGDLSLVRGLSKQASTLGREAAEVRGLIDDVHKIAVSQTASVQALAQQLKQVAAAQASIGSETRSGLAAVAEVSTAVAGVGNEVGAIVDTLRRVSSAAADITKIALQTRLVAFNASVEAKRAGEAGRGFAVVADAVKDLASQVEASSKQIASTVAQLDARVAVLASEIQRDAAQGAGGSGAGGAGGVHRAIAVVQQGVQRICAAAENSQQVCSGLDQEMAHMAADTQRAQLSLDKVLARTETFLTFSERLIETTAESGAQTEDTTYIQSAQQAASQISKLLDDALRTGVISQADLFDSQYQSVPGTAPAQHSTRFCALADRLFPQVQDKLLALSDKVVFCIAADRNGYVACHNPKYNQPQRPGDVAWNTANSRNRRIFNDRTGLASGRNQRPFLLQTYRRDMGGGQFVVMKEVAAPIMAGGKHWGGLRLAFKF